MNSIKINPFGLKRADTLRKYLHTLQAVSGIRFNRGKPAPGKRYKDCTPIQTTPRDRMLFIANPAIYYYFTLIPFCSGTFFA
jgi:hypothetical protein